MSDIPKRCNCPQCQPIGADCPAAAEIAIAELGALKAEHDQLRKGLEQLHHECCVDLPDEGMTIPQLITSLLTKAHDIDTRNLALRAALEKGGAK